MTLADEIATYLAGSGQAESAEEIARGVGHRAYTVRYILQNDPRFVLDPGPHQYPWSKHYLVSPNGRAGDGTGRKITHNEKVLALLSDGQPHSHLEIYDLRVVAHSRVAALRKLGHKIECSREGGLYMYRLEVAA